MVVAIVVLCFGLKTGGHFQRDERSTASAQKQMKYALLLFAVATSGPLIVRLFGNNMLPPSKLVLDMVQHALPLWMAAAVWWLIWKPNDRTLT
jgi:thiol:disulfide interchange protein